MGNNKVQEAVACFKEEYNCAQAVLSAFCEELGMDRTAALRVAAGLGGGIGRLQGPCGAVTGAILVIGLKYGSTERDKEAKDKTYSTVREFIRLFELRNQSYICRDLLGCGFGEEDRQIASERIKTICPKMVADAAEILESLLSETE